MPYLYCREAVGSRIFLDRDHDAVAKERLSLRRRKPRKVEMAGQTPFAIIMGCSL